VTSSNENNNFAQLTDRANLNIYKAYIGEGNNAQTVKAVLKSRGWWNINDKLKVKE
jgi:hypothetical protein